MSNVETDTSRVDALVHVRAALGQLRHLSSVAQMIDRVPIELCETCGFDRAVFFRVDDDRLIGQSARFTGAADWCAHFLELARHTPIVLQPPLAEAEVIRQRRAMIVPDPLHDPRALCSLMRAARPDSYVVAPVVADQRVAGMLHADHFGSGRDVDATDRDTLWAFAEGFGYALERLTLVERLRDQRARIMRSLNEAPEAIAAPSRQVAQTGPDAEQAPSRARPPLSDFEVAAELFKERFARDLGDPDDSADLGQLTKRELEVLQLIAGGATNHGIADTLVISEQTVKSHVKNILRKLGAANRTEAASRLATPAAR